MTTLPFAETIEARGARLQAEYAEADLQLSRAGIRDVVLVWGSTRAPEDGADYQAARAFGRLAGAAASRSQGGAVMTGGGPGIMEAANRGAAEAGAPSVGLNIRLPREQAPNRFITPGLAQEFRYFALRKLHFMLRARALVCFPGGFGTFDELFEALTLVQTGKVEPMPIVLVRAAFWRRAFDAEFLAAEGVIAPEDRNLFQIADTAEAAWQAIEAWYARRGESVFPCTPPRSCP